MRGIDSHFVSPLSRCIQTHKMIWPEKRFEINTNLVEQNFGDWDGKLLSEIPNIGYLTNSTLFKFKPPNGESHGEMSSRIKLGILYVAKKTKKKSSLVVAHAGTIRSAIGLTLKSKCDCLNYKIDNLSITRIKLEKNGNFSLIDYNFVV